NDDCALSHGRRHLVHLPGGFDGGRPLGHYCRDSHHHDYRARGYPHGRPDFLGFNGAAQETGVFLMNAINDAWVSANDTGVLRLITAGSVDDGKSTLIGRLLYDSKGVLADQMASISRSKYKRVAVGEIDLSLLTDGLEAEREQAITIDVAYRYFATPLRKFIIADAPGHEQYTRNMVTGASTAQAAIV